MLTGTSYIGQTRWMCKVSPRRVRPIIVRVVMGRQSVIRIACLHRRSRHASASLAHGRATDRRDVQGLCVPSRWPDKLVWLATQAFLLPPTQGYRRVHLSLPGAGKAREPAGKEAIMAKFLNTARRFIREEDGPTTVEYATMLGIIAGAALVSMASFGDKMNQIYVRLEGALSAADPPDA